MRQTEQRTDWEVETAAGVLVRTFDDEQAARDWVFLRRRELPGLQVVRVTVTETRERVYRPRAALRAAA